MRTKISALFVAVSLLGGGVGAIKSKDCNCEAPSYSSAYYLYTCNNPPPNYYDMQQQTVENAINNCSYANCEYQCNSYGCWYGWGQTNPVNCELVSYGESFIAAPDDCVFQATARGTCHCN